MSEFTVVNSDEDDESFEVLKASIKDGGQQVPVLVRRSASEGRFEVIYGRRRLRACRELNIKVRANVQDLDDANALLAKGLENAVRRNLSFYEKARFAQAIQHAGHDTTTVRQVLSLTPPGLSHLTKITQNVPNDIGDAIGPAPKSGRPKWTALADLFSSGKLSPRDATKVVNSFGSAIGSDEKLDALIAEGTKREPRQTNLVQASEPIVGVTITSGKTSLSLSVKTTGKNAAFGKWLDRHLDQIIKKSYAEFTAVNSGDET